MGVDIRGLFALQVCCSFFFFFFFPGQPPYPPLSPQLVHAIKTVLTHLPSLIQTSLKANPITKIMLDKCVFFCRTTDKFKLNAATFTFGSAECFYFSFVWNWAKLSEGQLLASGWGWPLGLSVFSVKPCTGTGNTCSHSFVIWTVSICDHGDQNRYCLAKLWCFPNIEPDGFSI